MLHDLNVYGPPTVQGTGYSKPTRATQDGGIIYGLTRITLEPSTLSPLLLLVMMEYGLLCTLGTLLFRLTRITWDYVIAARPCQMG